jgi:5-hydroxyisourate hydrolase
VPTLSTHVLDVAAGQPAEGMEVTLTAAESGEHVSAPVYARTDAQGRITGPIGGMLAPGSWTLSFAVGSFYRERQGAGCMGTFAVTLLLAEERHYHVPLLATPNAATSYLGT